MAASPEDREHARQLLKIRRQRLYLREEQQARLGDSADPSIALDIAQLRADIAALDILVNAPEPSGDVQDAIDRHLLGDNLRFIFWQVAQFGERLTHVEERSDQTAQAQHAAQLDRLATRDAIARLETTAAANDDARKRGQWLNRSLLIAILGIALAGILILLVWLDGRRVLAGILGYLLLSAFVGLAVGRYLRWRAGG